MGIPPHWVIVPPCRNVQNCHNARLAVRRGLPKHGAARRDGLGASIKDIAIAAGTGGSPDARQAGSARIWQHEPDRARIPGRAGLRPRLHVSPAGPQHRRQPVGAAAAGRARPVPAGRGRGRPGRLGPARARGLAGPAVRGRDRPAADDGGAHHAADLLLWHRAPVGRADDHGVGYHGDRRHGRSPPGPCGLGRGQPGIGAARSPRRGVPAGLRGVDSGAGRLGPAVASPSGRVSGRPSVAAARGRLRHRRPRQQLHRLGRRRGPAGRGRGPGPGRGGVSPGDRAGLRAAPGHGRRRTGSADVAAGRRPRAGVGPAGRGRPGEAGGLTACARPRSTGPASHRCRRPRRPRRPRGRHR